MPADFSIYAQPKVDCHCHVLDPDQFAYAPDVAYRPAGQETGSASYFAQVLQAYGVKHALLVGPNSGYGTDNRCLLDAIAHGQGRFKGIAVVPNDASALQLFAQTVPEETMRHHILWRTPVRLFGFGQA